MAYPTSLVCEPAMRWRAVTDDTPRPIRMLRWSHRGRNSSANSLILTLRACTSCSTSRSLPPTRSSRSVSVSCSGPPSGRFSGSSWPMRARILRLTIERNRSGSSFRPTAASTTEFWSRGRSPSPALAMIIAMMSCISKCPNVASSPSMTGSCDR